jgi:RND family efflux transporter MFP subunit
MQTEEQIKETKRKGKVLIRWERAALAVLLLGGLLGVLLFVFRSQLTPAVKVETSRVILLADNSDVESASLASDELLFQASGWLEPDPWPIKVATLTDGFVEEVFFKEGESVKKGDLLARLDQADAKLALRNAEAAVSAAKARLSDSQDKWERISALPDRDTTPAERIASKSDMLAKKAALESADTSRDIAKLALDRTEIRSPMDGIVLKRFVDPGSKRSRSVDDPNSAAIASLFDPASLQVRVDVPLPEAGKLFAGQPTRISTAMLPGSSFTGKVTRIVGEADLQRNTLQAKVEVHNPDARMRPDVLCRVEFWGGGRPAGPTAVATGRHTVWVAEEALDPTSGAEQQVWVVDPISQKAQARNVRLGDSKRDGYRRVLEGLRPNETVVTEGAKDLREGRRVTSAKEEDTDE